MPRNGYEDGGYDAPSGKNYQRDIILSVNEFCFVQNKSNGSIRTHTGPIITSISGQESLVVFNEKTKRFSETQDFEAARQLFVSAPEGWYVELKNPAPDNKHPEAAQANSSPALQIGRKINIPGPSSFSLFPGQMARVIRGHRLRSNQYLLARVYDAEAAKKFSSSGTVVDAQGNAVKSVSEDYFVGQLLVIKGTEVSFYVPPTGIEVLPVEGSRAGGTATYVRDAVTLERLEYAILKDEDGEKRYIHGPAVVFPKPTESFVTTPRGGTIFRALELSPISGIYVKVIAEYKDDDGTTHPVGEELFITGKDQMIYYPRPEHSVIQYDGKYMHHAIAIPEGEGRYILDRLTGNIKTVKGPRMYLPDPRTEVVVKRKLTDKECELLYPGNSEVKRYNESVTERGVERAAAKGLCSATMDSLADRLVCSADRESTLAFFESNANISRGTSYTKPRTITLDTKYEGVVTVDVWTGYAINVVSRGGKREVVVGPATRLLDYDETVEAMALSTGKPKTTDHLLYTGFLRIENNKVSDIVRAQTSDYVDVEIYLSYCVNFLEKYKDKWFNVDNYVKYLCDRVRSLIKREVRKHSIQDFYANSTDIVRDIALGRGGEAVDIDSADSDLPEGRLFKENGMLLSDVDVLKVEVDTFAAEILNRHQAEIVEKAVELADAAAQLEAEQKLASITSARTKLAYENELYEAKMRHEVEVDKLAKREDIRSKERLAEQAEREQEKSIQATLDAIQASKIAREKEKADATNLARRGAYEVEEAHAEKMAGIDKAKRESFAEAIKSVIASVGPDLAKALSDKANADLLTTATKNMSPYAIANGASVADTVDKLMRGTTLEGVIGGLAKTSLTDKD